MSGAHEPATASPKRPLRLRLGCLLLLIAVVTPLVVVTKRTADNSVRLSMCLNHASQWKNVFYGYHEAGMALPSDVGSLRSVNEGLSLLGGVNHNPLKDLAGFTCPGTDGRPLTPYVFIGGGLPPEVLDHDPLIFFCPHGAHAGSGCRHFSFGFWSPRRFYSEAAIRTVLETALQQAESGEVPYSAAAKEILRGEIALFED